MYWKDSVDNNTFFLAIYIVYSFVGHTLNGSVFLLFDVFKFILDTIQPFLETYIPIPKSILGALKSSSFCSPSMESLEKGFRPFPMVMLLDMN